MSTAIRCPAPNPSKLLAFRELDPLNVWARKNTNVLSGLWTSSLKSMGDVRLDQSDVPGLPVGVARIRAVQRSVIQRECNSSTPSRIAMKYLISFLAIANLIFPSVLHAAEEVEISRGTSWVEADPPRSCASVCDEKNPKYKAVALKKDGRLEHHPKYVCVSKTTRIPGGNHTERESWAGGCAYGIGKESKADTEFYCLCVTGR